MKVISWIGILILFTCLLIICARLWVVLSTRKSILSVVDAPIVRVAVVFGAGLRRDGSPTAILRDRVQTAVGLYTSGKVEKLLMSGDNRFVEYNEPAAMQEYAISLGVPIRDIVLDYAGRRTYDTCIRAREIFGLSDAILVTQAFHLPRAIYICNWTGLRATGIKADNVTFRRSSQVFWYLREIPATVNALIEVHITRPDPVLGDPEPIFP